jgi:serine/threonine-protein kinase HipA
VTSVPVWFDALQVGDVTVTGIGALGFSCSEAWLATDGAFPLSLTLPLDTIAYPSEVISPRLANLLPEEDQLNILVANTDAHAKKDVLLLPVGAGHRLAPLYDVSSALAWPSVTRFFAQNMAGRKRKPADVAAHHWNAIAGSAGYRPADVRDRVQQLADALVAKRLATTEAVVDLPGRTRGYVEEAAELIEDNALRIAGRLWTTRPEARRGEQASS